MSTKFSTLVELQSDNVCVYVYILKLWGSLAKSNVA